MTFKMLAAAALAFAALTLSGCNDNKAQEKPVTYDLSAASNQKYLSDNAQKPGVKIFSEG